MTGYLRIIRLPNLLIIAATMLAVRYGLLETLWHHGITLLLDQGYLPQGVGLHMSGFDFTLLVISTVFIAAAGYIINDYFDTKTDRINKPDRVVVGKTISRRWAITLHLVLSFLGLVIAAYLAWKCGHKKIAILQFVSILALWFYSSHLKKQMLSGNILIALLAAMVPITTGIFEFSNGALLSLEIMNVNTGTIGTTLLKEGMVMVIGYSVFAFLSNLIREIVKDIEDMDGDLEQGCRTLPIVAGEHQARFIAMSLAMFTMITLGLIMKYLWAYGLFEMFWYLAVAVQAPLIWLLFTLWNAIEKADYSRASLICKILIVTGVLSMVVFKFTF
jgi:4-hydroxybenzoate polyprenyltransferase